MMENYPQLQRRIRLTQITYIRVPTYWYTYIVYNFHYIVNLL